MYKICEGILCNKTLLSIENFSTHSKYCKQCVAYNYRNKYYKVRLDKLQTFRSNVKYGQSCCNCGEDNVKLLEFAHYNRKNKTCRLSQTLSIDKLEKELPKGRFLCVWCHRLETACENKDELQKRIYSLYNDPWDEYNNGKICNGKICNGKIRDSKYFYIRKRNNTIYGNCKRCIYLDGVLNREKLQKYVDSVKISIGKCQKCQIIVTPKTTCCFDFDHINIAEKITEVSNMVSKSMNMDLIVKEIKKCRVLCCKCHKIYTWSQLNYSEPVKPKIILICSICKVNVRICRCNL